MIPRALGQQPRSVGRSSVVDLATAAQKAQLARLENPCRLDTGAVSPFILAVEHPMVEAVMSSTIRIARTPRCCDGGPASGWRRRKQR